MYLRHIPTSDLVEVLDMRALVDPFQARIAGRFHAGEELQDPAYFGKEELKFPSGESLPECWRNPDYRERH